MGLGGPYPVLVDQAWVSHMKGEYLTSCTISPVPPPQTVCFIVLNIETGFCLLILLFSDGEFQSGVS